MLEWLPKAGANHHGMRARRFAERYTNDEPLQSTLEHHDRPYALWRRQRRTGREPARALDRLAARVPDRDLFVRFVELDGSIDGKEQEPVAWLRAELDRRSAGA